MKVTRTEIRKDMTCKDIGIAFAASGYEGMTPMAVNNDLNQILWHDIKGCEWGVSVIQLEEQADGVIFCNNEAVPLVSFCCLESEEDFTLDLPEIVSYNQLDYFLQQTAGDTRDFQVIGINVDNNTCLWHDHETGVYHIQRYLRMGGVVEFIGLPISTWIPS